MKSNTKSNTKLDILLADIDRKAMKKFNKFKVKTALVNSVSIPLLEKNYSNFLNENQNRIYKEELSLHEKEIDKLKNTVAEEEVVVKKEVVVKPKSKITMKVVLETYRMFKEKKSEFGFNREEMGIIYNEFFHNQKGCRYIAKALEKDEEQVRKQIAQLMSDFVA